MHLTLFPEQASECKLLHAFHLFLVQHAARFLPRLAAYTVQDTDKVSLLVAVSCCGQCCHGHVMVCQVVAAWHHAGAAQLSMVPASSGLARLCGCVQHGEHNFRSERMQHYPAAQLCLHGVYSCFRLGDASQAMLESWCCWPCASI
jgi:hypothetical protein